MKKIRLISIALIFTFLSQMAVFAKKNTLYSDNIKMIMCSGGKVAITDKADTVLAVPPYTDNGNVMLPAKYLLEGCGYDVEENENTLTAKGNKSISVTADGSITVDGKSEKLAATENKNGELFTSADICDYIGKKYNITQNGLFVMFEKNTESFDENLLLRLQGIYMSPDGKGSAGTVNAPVGTLDEAKKLAAKYLREYGEDYPVHIFVKGGLYHFSKTVKFDDEIFNSDLNKVVSIESYDDEMPQFTGAQTLDTADFIPVSDPYTLARLPKEGRGKVAYIDLKKAGIEQLENKANVFNYIYLNDIEQTNARWPNNGEATVFSVPQTNSFTFSEAAPTRWTEAKNAYVFGHFSSWRWEWHQGIIKSVDPATKTINIVGANGSETMRSSASGTGWYAQNLLEELDMPGEWYVDQENMLLYYYPPYKLKNQKLEIMTCNDTLIEFTYGKNISIKGINFTKCYQGLLFKGSPKNVTIDKCKFSHQQAYYAVQFPNGAGTLNVTITNNEVYNLFGAFCYVKTGNLGRLTDGNCLIKNNVIIQVAQYYKNAGAICGPYQVENFGSVGTTVEHNVIQDIPGGAGVGLGGTHIKITNNEIVNAGKYMNDYGAIYMGRSSSYFDTEIAYNFLHNFNNSNDYKGLYNDDAFAGAYWHHNIMVDMESPSNQAPGFNTRYMYNISVNCAKDGINGSRKNFNNGGRIKHGGADWKETEKLVKENEDVYKEQYPQIFDWLERKDDEGWYNVCWDSVFFGNIGINCSNGTGLVDELSQYGAKEIERNGKAFSIENLNGTSEGNPRYDVSEEDVFVDPSHQNYNVKPDSEQAKAYPELLDIDVEQIGLTSDAQYLLQKPEHGSHLVYPTNGIKNINAGSITFSWDPVKGASFYRLIIATDSKLESVVYDKEFRENGNTNNVTVEGLSNSKVYYWKVVAKSVTRQNQFEIDSIGGPYAFRTADKDTLQKDNIRLAITAYEAFYNDDLQSKDYKFDEEFINYAGEVLERAKKAFISASTQEELDSLEQELYYVIKKSPFFMNIHYENVNGIYDSGAKWDVNYSGKISVDSDKVLTFSSNNERADAKTEIKNRNSVLCFKMKLANLGTSAGDYQGFDIKMNKNGYGYLMVVKHDIIEWQRIGRTLTEIPNDFIEADKWYDVMTGGINTPNGVLQFFKVDGRIIYAELDQTANQTRDEGYFNIRKNGKGSIQLKDMEEVPQDGILIDEILENFGNPRSAKHLQTLLIGSGDTMEISDSKLFATLDKSKIADVLFPILQSRKISASRYDVSEYKKILTEACVVAGYNQGLAELLFRNNTDLMYNDIIKADLIDENGVTIYKWYNDMSDIYKAKANNAMLKGNCGSIEELRRHMAKYMITYVINACFNSHAGRSDYISEVLTKENADYVGLEINDYLSLTPEQKLIANNYIGNNGEVSGDRSFDELAEDIHTAVKNLK